MIILTRVRCIDNDEVKWLDPEDRKTMLMNQVRAVFKV